MSFFFKMHDIITHKSTTLTAKNEILKHAIYYLLSLFISILPTGSDYVHLGGSPISQHAVLSQSSRTKMERITLLLVQGRGQEGRGREGWEGSREGGGGKVGSDSCILFSVPLPSIESSF